MGFAGKRFPFWPPLPLPAASISVALAPIFTLPKSKKQLEWAENPKETLATQASLFANQPWQIANLPTGTKDHNRGKILLLV